VTRAAPHHLIADGTPGSVRSTRGGDAWQARQEDVGQGQEPETTGRGQVLLGMPARPRAARSG
jgi:tRNA-2-methylthio-N6-dimethylallyladenosine synthase